MSNLRGTSKIERKLEEEKKGGAVKVKIGKFVRTTAGGNHAYFESNIGQIRKPLK